jgi:hypothetical protein
MNATSRVNRITPAPYRPAARRYVHVSTDYRWVSLDPLNPLTQSFVKVSPGQTYRRPA